MSQLIRPFHVFFHKGSSYLINVVGMKAHAIDDDIVEMLNTHHAEDSEIALPEAELLKQYGLLRERPLSPPSNHKKNSPPAFTNISLFVTQTCNLQCIYCYGDGGGYGSCATTMTSHTARTAVDWMIKQAGDNEKLNIGFFGGEPLLNFPLMKEIVAYALKRGEENQKTFTFCITTNATLLDEEKIAFLKEHAIKVMVSFDGPKDIHDLQRPYKGGKGSYDDVLAKTQQLLSALPDTMGHAILVDRKNHDVVMNELKNRGFAQGSVAPLSASLFGRGCSPEASLHEDARIPAAEEEAEQWLRYIAARDHESLKQLTHYGQLSYGIHCFINKEKRYFSCGAGLGLAGVSCSGDVFLCHRFVGNDEYKLGSIFDSEPLNRDAYLQSPTVAQEKCSDCFAKYLCAGGCKHDNLGKKGSISSPPEDTCHFNRRIMELSAFISAHLDDHDKMFLDKYALITKKPCPFDF